MGTPNDTPTPVVSARGIHKSFGRTRALDGFDMTVAPGTVHGFLGPNGAGKSTALRAMLGLVRIDSGELEVLGMDPRRDGPGLRRRLAYVPGDVALWPNLTGGETIDMLIRMRGAVPDGPGSRRDELIERFGLDPHKRARAYSKGNRQKVALIAAFSVPSELMLLDEPTSGLDPLVKRVFNDCVHDAITRGATVVLSSHVLAEIEHLVGPITIIRAGRAVETGDLADMQHLHNTRIRVTFDGAVPDLGSLDGVSDVVVDGPTVECAVTNDALSAVLASVAAMDVSALSAGPPSLEDLFMDAYRTDPR